ncbi:hypothetical protein OROHE_012552 [Orobanche hederae]
MEIDGLRLELHGNHVGMFDYGCYQHLIVFLRPDRR